MIGKRAAASAVAEYTAPVTVTRLRPEFRDEFERLMEVLRANGVEDPPGTAKRWIREKHGDAAFSFMDLPDTRGNPLRNIVEWFRIKLNNAQHHFNERRYRHDADQGRAHRAP